jgi:iron(III) transport system permease protein
VLPLTLAAVVTAAVLLSPIYLVLRAASQGSAVWTDLTAAKALHALARTVWLTVTVTGAGIVLAVPLAWLTVRTDLPLRGLWSVLLALPLAIPSFVGGFVTVSALGPGGMFQDVLEPLGVRSLPSLYGFPGAWLTITFLSYPYIYLPVRAALRRADPAIEEAARGLGKSAWETFLRVNLPQLRPAISAGAILLALYVVSEFGAVSMLRYDTLTPLVYIEYTTSFNRSSAAVLGLPLVGLAVLFVLLDGLTRGSARYHAGGQRRPVSVRPLGVWRWPAVLLCLVTTGVGLGIPLIVIGYWLLSGLVSGQSPVFIAAAVVNSARLSGLTAVGAVLAALPIVTLSVRHPGVLSRVLEKATYSGQSLPGITIALSLVFFSANYLPAFYQSLGLLIFALVIRFLPEAVGACRSALLQVNPHTEEVARSLGAGPARVFLRITVPQILPGMSAGALLVFLTAIKELQITLLLSPIGFDTLATQIWSATSEAFFTRAALPSILLVVLSGIGVFLVLWRERMDR